jgi:hypothetical protein
MEDERDIIIIRFDMEVLVDLPEGVKCRDDDYEPSEESKERAIEAALNAFPERINIYIDGEDKPPTKVVFYVEEHNIDEVRVEPE